MTQFDPTAPARPSAAVQFIEGPRGPAGPPETETTTGVHGIVDMAQLKQVRLHDGTSYPERGAFAASVEFQGPTDPALQSGLQVQDSDTWIQTT